MAAVRVEKNADAAAGAGASIHENWFANNKSPPPPPEARPEVEMHMIVNAESHLNDAEISLDNVELKDGMRFSAPPELATRSDGRGARRRFRKRIYLALVLLSAMCITCGVVFGRPASASDAPMAPLPGALNVSLDDLTFDNADADSSISSQSESAGGDTAGTGTTPAMPQTPTVSLAPTPAPPSCYAALVITAKTFDVGSKGTARLFLHSSETSWNIDYGTSAKEAAISLSKDVSTSVVSWTVKVAGGRKWAVTVLDDKDSDGKMNTNWLGIPSEGVGASRGAKGGPFGGPAFDKAAFDVECSASTTMTVMAVEVNLWSVNW